MAAPAAWGGAATKMAWSEQVDEEEEQNGPLDQAFPTLGEAVKVVQKVGKKKTKGTTLSLNEFMTAPVQRPGVFAAGSAARGAVRATEDKSIMLSLPTGSRGKVEGEEQPSGGLGGAFSQYGGDRGRGGGFSSRRSDDGDDRPPREASRADEADDWGAMRKFTPSSGGPGGGGGGGGGRSFGSGGFGDRDRPGGGGFGDRDRPRGGGDFEDRPPRREFAPSAADEVSDWGATRKFTPSSGGPAGGGGGGGSGGSFSGGGYREREPLGGGFRDRDGPSRREGGGFTEGPSRADEESTWGRGRSFAPSADAAPRGASGDRGARGYGFGNEASSAADTEDRWARSAPQPTEAAAPAAPAAPSAPAERPRLKLAARTKPIEPITVTEPAAESASAAATAPAEEGAGAAAADGEEGAATEKPKKSNPFGAARPREEVLKEKGVDWKKEELKLEHGEVIRDKAPEEAELEKEVEELRVKLEALKELEPGETDTLETMSAELDEKEKALYKLQAELDDKVRFAKGKPEPREPRPTELDPRAGEFEPARPARGASSGGNAPADGGRGPREGYSPKDGPPGGPRGGPPRERSQDRRDGPPGAPRDGSRDRRGADRRGPPPPLPRPGAERGRAW